MFPPTCAQCGGRHAEDRVCPAKVARFFDADAPGFAKVRANKAEDEAIKIWHKRWPPKPPSPSV